MANLQKAQHTSKNCKVNFVIVSVLFLSFFYSYHFLLLGLAEEDRIRILEEFLTGTKDWHWFSNECDTTRILSQIQRAMIKLTQKETFEEVQQTFPKDTTPQQLNSWIPIFQENEKARFAEQGKTGRGRKKTEVQTNDLPPELIGTLDIVSILKHQCLKMPVLCPTAVSLF